MSKITNDGELNPVFARDAL